MKTRILKNLMMAGLASFALSIPAKATQYNLDYMDSRFLGYVITGNPVSGTEADLVTFLKNLDLQTVGNFDSNEFMRSGVFPATPPPPENPLPEVGAKLSVPPADAFSIDNVAYVLANYEGMFSFVWYVGDVGTSGNMGIIVADFGAPDYVNLYAPATQGGGNVPDGGATLMLLGSAVAGMVFLGRKRV